MRLTLTVLRCPPAVAPETRALNGGEFTIGRGPGVDWVLSDVNQMVSRRHCSLAFRDGAWRITDDSANGTFTNHDDKPIGKGNETALRDHDRLRIGPYEIEVHLAEAFPEPTQAGSRVDDPFGDSLWPTGAGSPGRAFDDPFVNRTQDDHSSALNDAMRPGGRLPADDLLPEGWDNDLLAELPGAAPAPPDVTPRPLSAAPDAPIPPVSSAGEAASPDDTTLLASFLAGAGLPDARPADPSTTMRQLGETFRALVSGLRAVLIARASIKSEFRIEQTMIRARNNNPLKFSADDDDAVSALLGVGRHTGVTPAKAVTDALRDIRLHELASMAAMQSAVRALLQGLDPAKVKASVEQGGRSVMPNHGKARAWDAYEALHGRITRALGDDFDSVFGKAFARAYEDALEDLAGRDRP